MTMTNVCRRIIGEKVRCEANISRILRGIGTRKHERKERDKHAEIASSSPSPKSLERI